MRKHNFVVGYRGEGQCIYTKSPFVRHLYEHIDPMTLLQAKKLAERIKYGTEKAVIYKLVEFKGLSSNKKEKT